MFNYHSPQHRIFFEFYIFIDYGQRTTDYGLSLRLRVNETTSFAELRINGESESRTFFV